MYKNRESFVTDFKLLVENSALYNGSGHFITQSAEKLLSLCLMRLEEKQEQMTKLEKAINPLLDGDNLIRLHFLLDKIFEKRIMSVDNSFAFLKPVSKTKYRDYYDIIKRPIDLEAIKQVLFQF